MLFDILKYQHDQLQRILNAAALNVCLVHTFSHQTSVLYILHWLPVSYRIQFKILLLVHPALSGVAPVYLKEASKRSGSHNLRSKLSCEFKVPKTKWETLGDRAFARVGLRVWSTLPSAIRSIQSLQGFKQALKTFWFRLAFAQWTNSCKVIAMFYFHFL